MFCAIERCGTSENSWKITAMPSRFASAGDPIATGSPSKKNSPASARYAPNSTFISDDLPAPFSPSSMCTSPGYSCKSTSESARTPGKLLQILRSSSRGTGLLEVMVSIPTSAVRMIWGRCATRHRPRVVRSVADYFVPFRALSLVARHLERRVIRLVDHDALDQNRRRHGLLAQCAHRGHRRDAAHLEAVEFGGREQAPVLDRLHRFRHAADADDFRVLAASRFERLDRAHRHHVRRGKYTVDLRIRLDQVFRHLQRLQTLVVRRL